MAEEVEVLVANVLDSYRVALNAGLNRGIEVGDGVTIWRLVDVTDPESGEKLGAVRLDKLKLEVTIAEPRYSVASVRSSSSLGAMSFFTPRKRIAAGQSSGSDDVVSVAVGDEATVYVSDDEPST